MLPQLLRRDSDGFDTTLELTDGVVGEASLAAVTAAPSYAALIDMIRATTRGGEADAADKGKAIDLTLKRVALLVDAQAATELISRLTKLGLSPTDPRLDLLHLNAALKPEIPA
jgi:hypothetical protein